MMHQSRDNKPVNNVGSQSVGETYSLAHVTGPAVGLREPYVPSEELERAAKLLRLQGEGPGVLFSGAFLWLEDAFWRHKDLHRGPESPILKIMRAVWLLPRRATLDDFKEAVESARRSLNVFGRGLFSDPSLRFNVASLMHSEGGGGNSEARRYISGVLEEADRKRRAWDIIREKGLSICDRLDISRKPDELRPLWYELEELAAELMSEMFRKP